MIEANGAELWLRTGQHIMLTGVSTLIAIAVGIPLGVFAAKRAWAERPLLAGVGILQTVPSLAMLALLLAMLQQIGALPAIIALTLYALLPIVRNTVTGLRGIAPEILRGGARRRHDGRPATAPRRAAAGASRASSPACARPPWSASALRRYRPSSAPAGWASSSIAGSRSPIPI